MPSKFESLALVRLSQALSIVFSPLLIPAYCTLVAFSVTPLVMIPLQVRALTFSVILALTAVVPLALLWFMKRRGRISDIDISNRSQRLVPMLLTLACYCATIWYVYAIHAPGWLVRYFASGIVAAVVLTLITVLCRWKISMHGAGMGSLVGFVAALGFYHYSPFTLIKETMILVVLAGFVCTARLILHRHTPMQVLAGTVVTALITFFVMGLPIL